MHIGSGNYNTISINGKTYALLSKEQLQGHSYKIMGIYYENFNCDNRTAYHTVKELSTGQHFQLFNFSGQAAMAYNTVANSTCDQGDNLTECNLTTMHGVTNGSVLQYNILHILNGGALRNQSPTAQFVINASQIIIESGGRIEGNVNITAANLTILAGGMINATATGFPIGGGTGAGGPSSVSGGGGGGYGGNGGDGQTSSPGRGGTVYGNALAPTDMGSGGGNGQSGNNAGTGGGAIMINVTNTLIVNGTIAADGGIGSGGSAGGGGSGGSVYIIANSFQVIGNITAKGGNGLDGSIDDGGPGGGGRIAIYMTDGILNGTISSGRGSAAPSSETAMGGSIYLSVNNTQINGNIVGSNITIIANSLNITNKANVSVNQGPKENNGTGKGGISSSGGGGGGGYGGNGGDGESTAGPGGLAYGSMLAPTDMGSGGGNGGGSGSIYNGGNGGGAIKINVTGTLILNGTISADGEIGKYNSAGGGGSGGSIYVIANSLQASGNITAKGGNGFDGSFADGGGGGGGRIAIYIGDGILNGIISSERGLGAPISENAMGGSIYLSVNNSEITNNIIGTSNIIGGNITILANNLNITKTTNINASFQGNKEKNGTGKGGDSGNGGGGGGGYGGKGGNGESVAGPGGLAYGNIFAPTEIGSGGGSGGGSGTGYNGGNGGGAININVTGTLIVNGTITADGEIGKNSAAGGGGGGGSVYIIANLFQALGNITAKGGNGFDGSFADGGGGGGGRIAVYYKTGPTTLILNASGGNKAPNSNPGLNGTNFSASLINVQLTLNQTTVLTTGTNLTIYGNFTVSAYNLTNYTISVFIGNVQYFINDSEVALKNSTTTSTPKTNDTSGGTNTGGFRYNITIPDSLADGNYTLAVNTTLAIISGSATASFIVDTAPPSAFNLTSPPNNTISGNLVPTFNWNTTVEANFVNYTLQISNGSDFFTINYTAISTVRTEANATVAVLNNKTWFWRVIAFDLVGNNFTSSYFNYTTNFDTVSNNTCNEGDYQTLCVISSIKGVNNGTFLQYNNLTIKSGGALRNQSPTAFFKINATNIIIQSGGKIEGNVNITAANLTILAGGMINATATGFPQQSGTGKGGNTGNGGGGAGYGGLGGHGQSSPGSGGSVTYGNVLAPTDMGSGGGQGNDGAVAGSGGGAIKINVTNTLIVNGTITADGEVGKGTSYPSGSGSGGSIYIITNLFQGAGNITAKGGDGSVGSLGNAGGGAGGRIAIYMTDGRLDGALSSKRGLGTTPAQSGMGGSIYLSVNNTQINSNILGGNITILANTLNITNIANINATFQGLREKNGTGKGGDTGNGGGGAGYGGLGGNGQSSPGSGGAVYGNSLTPTDMGSGGGRGNDGAVAGYGGGLIMINVTSTLIVNGTITADGEVGKGTSYPSGSGSGGSIYIIANSLQTAGNITAKGGDGFVGSLGNTGGGGGGRIAVYYLTGSPTLVLNSSGGAGTSVSGGGGNGTNLSASLINVQLSLNQTTNVVAGKNLTIYGNFTVSAYNLTNYTINVFIGNVQYFINDSEVALKNSTTASAPKTNDTSGGTNAGSFRYNITIPDSFAGGTYTLTVNSTLNIISGSASVSFSIPTANPPVINRNYTIPTYPQFNRNVTIQVNVTDADSSGDILSVNFTLIDPSGTKILNSKNGTRDNTSSSTDGSNRGDFWNSSSINLTSYGTWLWNISVFDIDGRIINITTGQMLLMQITENFNVTTATTNAPIGVSGHINLSNGSNVSNNAIRLFVDNAEQLPPASFTDTITVDFNKGTYNQTRTDAENITLDYNFGDGADGNLIISSGNSVINNYTFVVNLSLPAGSQVIGVNDTANNKFKIGDEILIIQLQNGSNTSGGGKAGNYEFAKIASISNNNITTERSLANGYFSGKFNNSASNSTQIVRVPHFVNVDVASGASITASAWNGWVGGIIAFRASGYVNISGSINVSSLGYRGALASALTRMEAAANLTTDIPVKEAMAGRAESRLIRQAE